MTVDTAQEGYTPLVVLELDPDMIEVDPKNARRKLPDIDRLAASFKAVGQLVPAIVAKTDTGYKMVAGHRRQAAARKAERLLRVIECDGEEAAIAISALVENTARADLTLAEQASAFQRVLDLGITDTDLAAATGTTTADIAALGQVQKSKSARAAVTKHPELSLEMAAAIAEFDGDSESQKALIETAERRPGFFDHQVAILRRNRDEAAKIEAKLATFRKAGVRVLTEAQLDKATSIDQLTDQAGKALTARGHMRCPGNGVAVVWPAHRGQREVMVFCTDPAANGHKRKVEPRPKRERNGPAPTPEAQEAEREERRATIRNNRELDTANGVRRAYVAKLVQGRGTPKGLVAFVAEQIVRGWVAVQIHNITAEVWEQISGKKSSRGDYLSSPAGPVLTAAKTDRDYLMALLGMVCAYHESTTDKTAWRQPSRARAHYMRFLESTGYTLTDQERMIITAGSKDR